MTSLNSGTDNIYQTNNSQPLHYYKGKLKFISEKEIYFVDQRNVAVVDIQNFFANGQQVTDDDMKIFREMVSSHGNSGNLEIESYVQKNTHDIQNIHNLCLLGKKQWRAQFAWVGSMPVAITKKIDKVYCMPLSYYTGKVKAVYENRLLFGDLRNSVMVNTDSFYVKGEKASVISKDFESILSPTDSVIHAYICKLHVLTFPGYKGPDPYLPTWPKGNYTSDLWVAKFAWQGPMPRAVKEEVGRYYLLRLNEWNFPGCFPWKVRGLDCINESHNNVKKIEVYSNDRNEEEVSSPDLTSLPIIPMEQSPGIMRGTFLIGDHSQALMTSFADVIAFQKENFYINGEKFRSRQSLSHFLDERKVYLSAWVQPLREPKCLFHVNVAWYAPCVWVGIIPEELKALQNEDVNKEHAGGNLIETKTNSLLRLTHFLGSLSNLSHSNGDFRCRVNHRHTVNISFRREALYINGAKFSGSMLNWSDVVQSSTWSILAYPVPAESHTPGILQYCAIAVWQYQYQVYMSVIPVLISEAADINLSHKRNSDLQAENESGYMTGWIIWICDDFGIINPSFTMEENVFMFFKKSVLYNDGEIWDDSYSLHEISSHQKCKVLAKSVPKREVFGFTITMEADMVWFGVKPKNVTRNAEVEEDETESRLWLSAGTLDPGHVLQAVHGVVLGVILMTDQTQGLVVSSRSIISFSSYNLYINGEKFKKHESLSDYCSGRQVNVRVLAVPLKEAKIVFNCKVICEAICVWIGEEPGNLKNLEIAYNTQKQNLIKYERNASKLPIAPGFFYMLGNVVKVGQYMGVLSCTTPKGFVKVAFWSKAVFMNSARLPENTNLSNHSSFGQPDWSCIAYPIAPTNYLGNIVRYSAVALWHPTDHHKIGHELLQLVSSEAQKLYKDIPSEKSLTKSAALTQSPLEIKSFNPSSSHGRTSQVEIFPHDKKEAEAQINTQNIIASCNKNCDPELAQKPEVCGNTGLQEKNTKNEVPTQAFYGRHVTGYVIKKYKDGGIAQWKSVRLQGYIYIQFSNKTLFVDLKPVNKKCKLSAIENRSCNFYVKPIPHNTVCGVTVSLEATCGWIGKKPPEIPIPGKQELANVSLSDVHLTPLETEPEDDGVLDLPLIPAKDENVSIPSIISISEKNDTSQDPAALLENNQNLSQTQEKITVSSISQNVLSEPISALDPLHEIPASNGVITPPSSSAATPSNTIGTSSSSDEGIWKFRCKQAGHLRGTLVGVFTNLGLLRGEDDKDHYFPRDACFLYGVPLGRVELWHVLFQGHKLLYTTIDKKPGSKVEKVWLGTLERHDKETTKWLIDQWCKDNAVLEGARMILLELV